MKTSLLFESGSNSLTDEALYVESIASASYKDFIANSFYLREKFEESLEDYFEILKNLWLEETKLSSNVFITLSHPAYLRIIKLGNDILPYILDDLQQNKNHWFFALNKISGENPVKVEHVGNIDLMANDWINWGKAKNMIAQTMIVLKEFPNSKVEPFIKTSDIAPHYNCIAWAFGDNSKWYEPDPFGFYYWPNDVPRQYSIPAYIKLYESIGFTICESGDLELGFEKIAVFAKNNIPTHAAKQLNDGVWSSKLGKNIDVSHTIFAIENGVYGQVSLFLKRLKSL